MKGKVFVAGGAGYIGCRLVPELLNAQWQVKVFDKLLFGDDGLAGVKDRIELEVGDLCEVEAKSLEGCDAVINLSGLSNDPTAEYNPEANKRMNTDATIRLARLCRDVGVKRYVFASSCSIYYSLTPTDEMRDEETPVDPTAPYSHSKRLAEIGLQEMAGDDFCPVILRKGTVYGQSPRMRYDLVVNVFTRDAFTKRRLIIHNKGRMWRPMLDIEDAARAYLTVLEAPDDQVCGEIFNVLNDNFTVLQIAHQTRQAVEQINSSLVQLDLQEIGPVRSYRVDGTKFEQRFGEDFSSDMIPSIKRMWDALEDGADYDNPIHYNLPWLELLIEMERRLRRMDYKVL